MTRAEVAAARFRAERGSPSPPRRGGNFYGHFPVGKMTKSWRERGYRIRPHHTLVGFTDEGDPIFVAGPRA